MSLLDGLIAYYKFDGDANDSSGVGPNGTATGISFSTGKVNQGAERSGGSSAIDLGSGVPLGSTWTIDLWVQTKIPPNHQGGLSDYGELLGLNGQNGLFLHQSGTGTLYLELWVGNNLRIQYALTPGTGYWVGMTYDGTTVRLYLNDSEVATWTGTISGWSIKALLNEDGTGSYPATALIDEMGVWDRVHSSGEQTTRYNGGTILPYPFGVTVPTNWYAKKTAGSSSQLVNEWKFPVYGGRKMRVSAKYKRVAGFIGSFRIGFQCLDEADAVLGTVWGTTQNNASATTDSVWQSLSFMNLDPIAGTYKARFVCEVGVSGSTAHSAGEFWLDNTHQEQAIFASLDDIEDGSGFKKVIANATDSLGRVIQMRRGGNDVLTTQLFQHSGSGADTLDNIADGASFGKVAASYLGGSGGEILGILNSDDASFVPGEDLFRFRNGTPNTLDNIIDGVTNGKVKQTQLTSGEITTVRRGANLVPVGNLFQYTGTGAGNLDNIGEGATYGKTRLAGMNGGYINTLDRSGVQSTVNQYFKPLGSSPDRLLPSYMTPAALEQMPPNGTFSSGTDGWSDVGGEKMSATTDGDIGGAGVLNCSFSPTTVGSGVESMPFPIPLASLYLNWRGAFRMTSAAAGDTLRIEMEWRAGPTTAAISTSTVDFDATAMGLYTLKEAVFTPPTNARWAVMRVKRQVAGGDGFSFNISTLQIESNLVKTIAGYVGVGGTPTLPLEVFGSEMRVTNTAGTVARYRAKTASNEFLMQSEDTTFSGWGLYDLNSAAWRITVLKASGQTAIGATAPSTVPRLYVQSLDRWDTWSSQIHGDFYVGTASVGIKMGIANSGGGIGAATIAAQGGINFLAIGAGSTQAQQQAIQITSGVVSITQEAWAAPTFGTNWSNFDASNQQAGYFKDSLGFVHLRGLVKRSSGSAAVFTLPAGFRPSRTSWFQVANNVAGGPYYIYVYSDGTVNFGTFSAAFSGAVGILSIEGIMFDTRS